MNKHYDTIVKYLQTKDKSVFPESWNSKEKYNNATNFNNNYQLKTNRQGQLVLMVQAVHLEDGYKEFRNVRHPKCFNWFCFVLFCFLFLIFNFFFF